MKGTLVLFPEGKGKKRRPTIVEVFVLKDGSVHTFVVGANNPERERIMIRHCRELRRTDRWSAVGVDY